MDQTNTQELGTQIYDSIMQEIEPELMSTVIPTLEEKYQNETPEEAKVRKARYDKAFAEYDKRYAAYMTKVEGQVKNLRKQALKQAEQNSRQEDESQLNSLEATMSTVA